MSVTRIDLHPVVRFDTGFQISEEEMEHMQDRAHRYCFIANTLADSVDVNILHSPTVRHFHPGEQNVAA